MVNIIRIFLIATVLILALGYVNANPQLLHLNAIGPQESVLYYGLEELAGEAGPDNPTGGNGLMWGSLGNADLGRGPGEADIVEMAYYVKAVRDGTVKGGNFDMNDNRGNTAGLSEPYSFYICKTNQEGIPATGSVIPFCAETPTFLGFFDISQELNFNINEPGVHCPIAPGGSRIPEDCEYGKVYQWRSINWVNNYELDVGSKYYFFYNKSTLYGNVVDLYGTNRATVGGAVTPAGLCKYSRHLIYNQIGNPLPYSCWFPAVWQLFGDNQSSIFCPDIDGDGDCDGVDNCPTTSNADQLNNDTDSFGNACDNCDLIANQNQADSDADGIGDLCEGTTQTNQSTTSAAPTTQLPIVKKQEQLIQAQNVLCTENDERGIIKYRFYILGIGAVLFLFGFMSAKRPIDKFLSVNKEGIIAGIIAAAVLWYFYLACTTFTNWKVFLPIVGGLALFGAWADSIWKPKQ